MESAKTRLRPAVESLDARIVPSKGLSASLAHGLLTINGTAGADVIVLNVVGKGGSNSTLVVEGVARYRLGKVQSIAVYGGEGNDHVAILDGGRAHIPASITEGSGNDTIQGGSGTDSIVVGNGNDQISDTPASTVTFGAGATYVDGVLQVHPAPTPAPTTTSTPVASTPTSPAPTSTTTTTTTTSAPTSTTPISSTPTTSTPSPVLPTPVASPTPAPTTPAETVAELVALTNSDRAANGVAALSLNSQLTQAAQIEANQMAEYETMAHTIPQAADPTLQSRATAVGYNFWLLGENIAAYYSDAASTETAWMASTDHRANILDASFTQFGVAVAFDAQNLPYYCVVFGEPPG